MVPTSPSISWKLANVPISPKLSAQKLKWLENRLLQVKHEFGTEHMTAASDIPQFRDLLHNFYHSSDEKTIDKEVICRFIVPTLAQHKTYLSIGAGDGKLSANVLAMGQFKEAYLMECAANIIPTLEKFFSITFKNRKPTLMHEILQAIAVSQGLELGKPRLKYHILRGEFPASQLYSERVVGSIYK